MTKFEAIKRTVPQGIVLFTFPKDNDALQPVLAFNRRYEIIAPKLIALRVPNKMKKR